VSSELKADELILLLWVAALGKHRANTSRLRFVAVDERLLGEYTFAHTPS
jgi:hypothetical protein